MEISEYGGLFAPRESPAIQRAIDVNRPWNASGPPQIGQQHGIGSQCLDTFDEAFHWNYIRGSLDPDSPYYYDTVASGKARRAGELSGPVYFRFDVCS